MDRRDLLPLALVEAGGQITHFGMPVDPGNLLLVGDLEGVPVVGVPSCAASPKLNGFDWVLGRLFAGMRVGNTEIAGMGVGGLLQEIPSRPQPRMPRSAPKAGRIAAIVLAAGRSTRMGERFKLTELFRGKPMIRHVCEAAAASAADLTIVVTGHKSDNVEAALIGIDVTATYNPAYGQGMSTSIRRGIQALPDDISAVIVLLGDMPLVGGGLVDRLIDEFNQSDGQTVQVPVVHGKRGNPVLWPSVFFSSLSKLSGDQRARSVIADNPESVVEVDVEDGAVLIDIDTLETLKKLG